MTHLSLLDAVLFSVPQCERWYYGDGECQEPATVYHIGGDLHLCHRHFNEFENDFGDQYPPKFTCAGCDQPIADPDSHHCPAVLEGIRQYSGTLINDLISLAERYDA